MKFDHRSNHWAFSTNTMDFKIQKNTGPLHTTKLCFMLRVEESEATLL